MVVWKCYATFWAGPITPVPSSPIRARGRSLRGSRKGASKDVTEAAQRPPPRLNADAARNSRPERVVELSTSTPMFGGSTDPLNSNPTSPIARSVREHLRFWGSAPNGPAYPWLLQLFEAES